MIRGKLQIVKRPGNPLSKRKFRVKCKLQYPWVWRQLVCLQCRQSIPITNWYSISNNHFKGLTCINMYHIFTWCSPMPNANIKFGNQAESLHHLVPRWWRICTTLAQDTPATADFCGRLFVAIQAHKIKITFDNRHIYIYIIYNLCSWLIIKYWIPEFVIFAGQLDVYWEILGISEDTCAERFAASSLQTW